MSEQSNCICGHDTFFLFLGKVLLADAETEARKRRNKIELGIDSEEHEFGKCQKE
jgi:hypothetical protein